MRLPRRVLGYALIAATIAAGGWVLWRCVPFDLASYSAWAGILLALLGIVSLIRPLRGLGVPTRARAAGLLLAGAGVTAAALAWPSPVARGVGQRRRLDKFLPEYQFSEYHEARTQAPMARVVEAVRHVSLADMPAADVLLRLRGLAGGFRDISREPIPLLDQMVQSGNGFLVLDASDPRELVYGMTGRPWSGDPPPPVRTPAEFRAFAAPGNARVAFDMRVVDEGEGITRVSTETRILGGDAGARRVFARYWRVIYPGSAIIRRVWLHAIVARAERPRAPDQAVTARAVAPPAPATARTAARSRR